MAVVFDLASYMLIYAMNMHIYARAHQVTVNWLGLSSPLLFSWRKARLLLWTRCLLNTNKRELLKAPISRPMTRHAQMASVIQQNS